MRWRTGCGLALGRLRSASFGVGVGFRSTASKKGRRPGRKDKNKEPRFDWVLMNCHRRILFHIEGRAPGASPIDCCWPGSNHLLCLRLDQLFRPRHRGLFDCALESARGVRSPGWGKVQVPLARHFWAAGAALALHLSRIVTSLWLNGRMSIRHAFLRSDGPRFQASYVAAQLFRVARVTAGRSTSLRHTHPRRSGSDPRRLKR